MADDRAFVAKQFRQFLEAVNGDDVGFTDVALEMTAPQFIDAICARLAPPVATAGRSERKLGAEVSPLEVSLVQMISHATGPDHAAFSDQTVFMSEHLANRMLNFVRDTGFLLATRIRAPTAGESSSEDEHEESGATRIRLLFVPGAAL